jgi:glycosyltransferase involved in cell wall biosynthesis
MYISIGMKIRQGPWGGGNAFGQCLSRHLEERGHQICFDLAPKGLDATILVDPLPNSETCTYNHIDISRYLLLKNPSAIVIHRINECDERKGTQGVNKMLMRASALSDHTVFISSYLRDLFEAGGYDRPETSVIRNGADPARYNRAANQPWNGDEPMRLVTHHWGSNRKKGFDVYEHVDRMLGEAAWRDRLAMTYVGNLPEGFAFEHIRHIPPLGGDALSNELAAHHVYLTASVNEPAGMHHIEGALTGLPLVYRLSGALPEYCEGSGVAFEGPHDVEQALESMLASYSKWREALTHYPYTADRMCAEYTDLIEQLVANRAAIVGARRRRTLWRGAMRGHGLENRFRR